MKTEAVKICAAAAGLVFLAAAQDVSPVVFGAKPPFLLIFGCLAGVPTAAVAGLFADALGGLPFGCSAIFFLAATLLCRRLGSFAVPAAVAAAALYQFWILAWGGDVPPYSACTAAVFAAVLYPATAPVLRLLKRLAGIDRPSGEVAR